MATPDRSPARTPRLYAVLPPDYAPNLRALTMATGTPQARIMRAALASEIAQRIARLNEAERRAFVAAGGTL